MYKIKSFGQHFLKNDHIALRIVEQLIVNDQIGSNVVEIGPGEGILTQFLLQRPEILNLFVVELDKRLPEILLKKFPKLEGHIINEDFLRVSLDSYLSAPFSVIGNFPYNISTQIVFKILDNRDAIPQMVGMFQKEVARRIASGPGNKDYGVTSVLVQAYYDVKYCFSVEAGNFDPPPKVQSGVIRLQRTHVYESQINDHNLFRQVVKLSFGQRRKMLRNALSELTIDEAALPPEQLSRRAEQLTVTEFIQLANNAAKK